MTHQSDHFFSEVGLNIRFGKKKKSFLRFYFSALKKKKLLDDIKQVTKIENQILLDATGFVETVVI